MNKITDWSFAQKLQESKCKGIIIGIAIAIAVLFLVVSVVIKIYLLKKHFCCSHSHCTCGGFDDDFMDDDDCIDEDGCCVANEKDFV